MKKTILAIAAAALVGTTVAPRPAQAFGVINIIATGGLDYVGSPQTYQEILMTTVCIVLLPLCILQDGTQAQDVMTSANLQANGFSAAATQEILKGHQEVSSRVAAAGKSGNVKAIVSEVAARNSSYGSFVQNF